MDPKLVTPVLLTALVAFAFYRRIRRTIGRQRVSPVRMQWRIGLLGVVGTMLLVSSLRDIELFGAMALGIAAGVALAMLGLRHTKFETSTEGSFYTPHTYIGLLVSALLIGRVLYRFAVVGTTMQAAAQSNSNPFAAYQSSPLTLGLFGIVVGYYVAYYAGVLLKSRATAAPSA